MVHLELRRTVFEHINSFSTVPVFYPNRATSSEFEKKRPVDFLHVNILPVDSRIQLLQIDIFQGLGKGDIKTMPLIDLVISNFSLGTRIPNLSYNFTSIAVPTLSPALAKNDRWIYSVTVKIRIDKKC